MKYSTKNLTRISGALIIAGLLAAGRAGAAELSRAASSFLKEASQANQGEIALAQLAEQKSQSAQVKELAQMIQKDHQASQQKLETIAQTHGLKLDQGLTFSEKRAQGKLEKLSGADLDQQFSKDMLEGHVANIKRFDKAARDVEEADVKQFAQETLPVLKSHLNHSETVAKASGVDQATISSITKSLPEGVGGTSDKQEKESGGSKMQPY
jgi:putative membrane protein